MRVTEAIQQLLGLSVFRYLLVSMIALVSDVATFSVVLRILGCTLVWAATTGFVVGVAVAYFLSILWVFETRVMIGRPFREFVVFFLIGVLGLGITNVVLWLGVQKMGWPPEIMKLLAAVFTFFSNFSVRKALLFVARPAGLGCGRV
jgi:putative flippase GtrA